MEMINPSNYVVTSGSGNNYMYCPGVNPGHVPCFTLGFGCSCPLCPINIGVCGVNCICGINFGLPIP